MVVGALIGILLGMIIKFIPLGVAGGLLVGAIFESVLLKKRRTV